ncbi:MAG: right-handed parallel beta-helix repeat-containing protein [Gemmatimonadetes bacterium]|nr:right-handed parallel beta-helix repeat-containing protein [Gemmatimonadota bacterium]
MIRSRTPWSALLRRLGIPVATVLLSIPGAPGAATLDVPSTFPTIASGLAAAAAGDTVLVACGTYSEHDLVIPDGVTLRGESSPPCVTIDAGFAGRVLDCPGGAGIRIESLRVTNGALPDAGDFIERVGGGLRCNSARVAVRDCVFEANAATYGAGLGARGGDVRLVDCTFTANVASAYNWASGGGIYGRDLNWNVGNCRFEFNSATSDSVPADGGGAFLDHCTGAIYDCEFEGNTALAGAGGVYSFAGDATSIVGCTFTDNTAGAGGAIYGETSRASVADCVFQGNVAANGGAAFVAKFSSVTYSGCEFSGNQATPYAGGAVECWQSVATFRACRFVGNSAALTGGAFNLNQGANVTIEDSLLGDNAAVAGGGAISARWTGTAALARCSIVGNAAPANGAALDVDNTASLDVTDSIIASQAGGAAATCAGVGSVEVRCTIVWDNPGGNFVGCLAGQGGSLGNLEVDPLFCDPGAGEWTLRFPDSPALAANNGCASDLGSEPIGCGCPVGATILVPGDYSTIAAALAAAVPGDVVGVCDGEYPEALNVVPGVHVVGFGPEFTHVVQRIGGEQLVSANAVVDSTVIQGLDLDARFLANWVVRADAGSVGLHLAGNRMHGGAVGGIRNSSDSRVTIGTTLARANDIFDNGLAIPLNVRNLNVAADSLPATLNWWGSTQYDQILSTFEGPVASCPITNQSHSDSLCAPLIALDAPAPGRGSFSLNAFPNPFRSGTRIRLSLGPGAARLVVYDVAGRRVRTLFEGPDPPSAVRWAGDTADGAPLPPGVYFLRLEAGDRSTVEKVVRLR